MAIYRHLEFPTDFKRYVLNKPESAKSYYRYLLTRCQSMFTYTGLPDTIPHEILERYLLTNGIACITKVGEKLYVFYGNAGGPQDEYYRPTQFIVANPHIKIDGKDFQANIHIFGQPNDGDTCEGVLLRNDTEWQGLNPLLSRYSFLLAENTLTMRTADVMLRIIALISAPSDKERSAADDFLRRMENGELSSVGESPFFDGIRMQSPAAHNGSYFTQFIEYHQYLTGTFFNEIGLQANYNMKREAIGKGESSLGEDSIMPLYENMLLCRKEDIAKVNELFGTSISVSPNSAWLTNAIENLKALQSSGSFGGGQAQGFAGTQPGNEQIGAQDEQIFGKAEPGDEPASSQEDTVPQPEKSQNVPETTDETNEHAGEGLAPEGTLGESEESKINDIGSETPIHTIYEDLVNQEESEEEVSEDVSEVEKTSDTEESNPEE